MKVIKELSPLQITLKKYFINLLHLTRIRNWSLQM